MSRLDGTATRPTNGDGRKASAGPPARVLVTKIGLDGHDRGSRIVAAFLRDAGMEVIYTPPWQSIAAVVKLAMEEDVDVIGVSSLATDHLIVPRLTEALRAAGLGYVGVVVTGLMHEGGNDDRARGDRVGRGRCRAGAHRGGCGDPERICHTVGQAGSLWPWSPAGSQ